jgi:hypothetical protein
MAKSSPLSGRIGPRFGGRGARKRTRIFAGLITLLAVTYLGSTFAASVSLGSGALEFGQGTRAAVACDSDGITTAISETFNASLAQFDVATVVLSGVNTEACAGKIFKVTLLGQTVDGTAPLLQLGNIDAATFASITISNANSPVSLTVSSGTDANGLTASKSGSSPSGIITLALDRVGTQDSNANFLNAGTVFRINLESDDA